MSTSHSVCDEHRACRYYIHSVLLTQFPSSLMIQSNEQVKLATWWAHAFIRICIKHGV